ncbi:MAG: polysaccharide biosynthesis/export family protein [Bdellovibrionales bacterium]|jgi:polysaccharide export outer membrane protein
MRKGHGFCFALVFSCAVLLFHLTSSWAALPVTAPKSAALRVQVASAADGDAQAVVSGNSGSQEYVLGTGDRIKLTVYGEADLSGEYEVGSTGIVAMPLIGDVRAAGQPIRSFEQAVRKKLAEGYLHDPRVSAQVINYRPFFILGEVSKPGSYPYVNGMTVINAVALAGGYTYRADKSGATISHANDPEKKDSPALEEAIVAPGDIIRVPERFF